MRLGESGAVRFLLSTAWTALPSGWVPRRTATSAAWSWGVRTCISLNFSVFFALLGEETDGHRFVSNAVAAGAALVVAAIGGFFLAAAAGLADCFVNKHPDAKYWLPGNPIHESEWVRLVVTQVYWIGGFGDRAYIGWIDAADWRNVTREEWEAVELPGEKKGWKEWSVPFYSDVSDL